MTRRTAARGRFAGRVALVTGAAGGQGAAAARLFAAEGAEVWVADVLVEQGAALAEELRTTGARASFLELDVSSEQSWDDAVAAVRCASGRLHVLVNNAGVSDRRGFIDQDPEAFSRVLAINLWGAVVGMRTCAPLIERSGGGAVVNICSVASLTGYDAAAYTASKWGLRGVSRTAAAELAERGIRVNCVMPGVIRTPTPARRPSQTSHGCARCPGRACPRRSPGRSCTSPATTRRTPSGPR